MRTGSLRKVTAGGQEMALAKTTLRTITRTKGTTATAEKECLGPVFRVALSGPRPEDGLQNKRSKESKPKKNKIMKLIKKNSTTKKITDAFKVGDAAKWLVSMFDGRISTFKEYTGTIVKVNRKTVDVEVANGNVYRLDAFIKISTGEWTLGVR